MFWCKHDREIRELRERIDRMEASFKAMEAAYLAVTDEVLKSPSKAQLSILHRIRALNDMQSEASNSTIRLEMIREMRRYSEMLNDLT